MDDIISNDALSKADKTDQLVWIISIMLVIFVILRPPVEYFRQYFAQWTSSKILYDIRDQLYTHIQKLSFKFYSNTKTGEVISRVINDVEQTKTFVVTGLMNVWLDFATILIAIAIMFTMDVTLTFVSLILIPFYVFSIKFFFGNLRS